MINNKTKEEIETFLNTLYPKEEYSNNYVNFRIDIDNKENKYTIYIRNMYEYVEFSTEILFKVCKFFNTFNINEDRYSSGGCDTCDYGSNYEITLVIKDGKPYEE